MSEELHYDVLVIGGGAAGLSGALILARARRSVLVVDSGGPRNAVADRVHGYLGREGTPPAQLYAAGRAEVASYGGEFHDGEVVSAERLAAGGFRAVLADGSAVRADRLLVTTGLVDELPPVPGLAERWGRDVLHCPYCHGWEVRDQAVGILATGPLAAHQALTFRQWSADVTLFRHTAPPLDPEQAEQLAARGIRVVDGEVTGVRVEDDRLTGVVLANGQEVSLQALAVGPRFTARAGVLASLGLEPVELLRDGHAVATRIPTDATGATAVPGVWAAGNVADPMAQVIVAAADGLRAAVAINTDLIETETRRAVESAAFWDNRYAESARIWSGEPNAALVREVEELAPGRALDLGSGEGGDAIWLARRGWQVTAVDISRIALDRAATQAATEGLGDRIDWQQRDLAADFPPGSFDLVAAQFLHSPNDDLPRERVLRRAAAAVAPGGVLLIVGHATVPAHPDGPHPELHLPTAEQVLAALNLPKDEWELLRWEEHERTKAGPDGQPTVWTDNTVKLRRHSRRGARPRDGR